MWLRPRICFEYTMKVPSGCSDGALYTVSLGAKSTHLPFNCGTFQVTLSSPSSLDGILKARSVCLCAHNLVCLPLPSDSANNAEYLMCMRWIGSGSCLLLTIELTSKGARLSLCRQHGKTGLGVAGLFTHNRQPQPCKAVYLPCHVFLLL